MKMPPEMATIAVNVHIDTDPMLRSLVRAAYGFVQAARSLEDEPSVAQNYLDAAEIKLLNLIAHLELEKINEDAA